MPLVSVKDDGNISVPEIMTNMPLWTKLIAAKVNQILRGKTNNIGEITLTASSATTTITVPIGTFGDKTAFLFDATTSTAATALGSGNMYVSSRAPDTGIYIISHPSNASANKTFRVAYIG